jgi:hypothetical protein
MQCTYNVTCRRVRVTAVAVEKQQLFTYSECVSVALGIQHAMRMSHTVLGSVRLYNTFPHYLINGEIFKKKIIKY